MTVTNTIGTGGGRDYGSITAWESATSISLSQTYIGEVYHDGTSGAPTFSLPAGSDRFLMQGATNVSSSRFRVLRAASGQQFDPKTKTGVFIERTPNATSVNTRTTVEIAEDYFRFTDMASRDKATAGNTSGEQRQVYVNNAWAVRVKRCYLEQSASFCDGTAGTSSGDILRFKTKSGAGFSLRGTVENCILVGGGRRGNRGATAGIRTEFGTTNIIANTIVDVVGHSETSGSGFGRGINMGASTGTCVGNLITRSLVLTTTTDNFFDYSNPTGATIFASNVSADTTAEATFAVNGSKNGQLPKQTFVSWINQDYRVLSTSFVASNSQVPLNLSAFTSVTDDYFGNARGTAYGEIGAIEGSLTTTEAPPTIVVTTIGTGGDYSTLSAWETATRGNLVEANEVRIGEVLGEVTGTVEISGSQTDEKRYRMIRPASSAYFKPENDSGAVIKATSGRTVILVGERYFHLEGPIKVFSTTISGSTLGGAGLVEIGTDADYTTIDGGFFSLASTAAVLAFPMPGILVRLGQQGTIIKNCTMAGNDAADTKGLMGGIRVQDASSGEIYNCTVWGTRNAASTATGQQGIRVDSNAAPGWTVKNCIAIDNNNSANVTSLDFDLASGVTSSNNLSGDTTGSTAALRSKTAADTFASHLSNNYYLRAGISDAIDAGVSLLGEGIRLDQARNGRNVPFDLGALDGAKPYPPFPSHKFRRRVAHCFEIERRDGVRLQFTDNPTPIVFRGATWSPASFTASARRREVGNKPMNLEISGGISSDKITLVDLRSGAYQGARMTEYVIDWRYPHLEPMQITRYTIEATTFDGEQFTGDVQGLPFILKTKIGNYYGRTCRHVLGNSECRAVYTTDTNIPVASVIEPRRSFYCLGLSNSTENNYRFGKLTWNSPTIATDVLSSKLVTVNQLSVPNTLTNSTWTKTETTVTAITNGFDTGVPAYLATASSNSTAHLVRQVLSTPWTTLVPARTKVCFSVYVERHDSSPADHVELRLINDGSPQNYFAAGFQHNGTAWVSSYNDPSTTVKVERKGTTNWYRISVGVIHDGQQPNNIGVGLRVGNEDDQSDSESVRFARAQLEVEVLEPTAYTEAQRHKIVLAIRNDFAFDVGARFSLEPGCNKLRSTCKTKFNNIKNYGGFPFVPGQDKQFDTPTQ